MSGDRDAWEGWGHTSENVRGYPFGVLRAGAVQMLVDVRNQDDSEWSPKCGRRAGVARDRAAETLRKWVRQGEVDILRCDAGARAGVTAE